VWQQGVEELTYSIRFLIGESPTGTADAKEDRVCRAGPGELNLIWPQDEAALI